MNLFPIPVWACPVYPSLSSGNADLQRFPHPLTTPLLLSAVFIIIFSKGDGDFLPRLLPRWGLSEQLDCPIDRGPRDSAL